MIAIITSSDKTYSNPTIKLIIEQLFEEDKEVTVFGPEQIFKFNSHGKKPTEIVIKQLVKLPKNPFKAILTIVEFVKISFFLWKNKINIVLAVDPEGLVIAGNLKIIQNRFSIHYLSFEILFSDEIKDNKYYKYIKNREMSYTKLVNSILIQDNNRQKLLMEENKLTQSDDKCIKWHFIPVAPKKIPIIDKSNNIRKLYGIDDNTKVILHSGSLVAWSGAEDYIELLDKGLPSGHLLFLHSRCRLGNGDAIINKLIDYQAKDYPVILHDEFIEDDYNFFQFISNFNYGICLYKSQDILYAGENLRNIGLASGKFAYYMASGLPTITSDLNTYRELNTKYQYGVLVNNVEDIITALNQNLLESVKQENCYNLYNEMLNPVARIENFVDTIIAAKK